MAPKIAVLLALALLTGCGYKAGFLVRDNIETVAVPVFANDTFYRNLEIDMTKAVVDRIEKETPYKLADSSDADAILEGRITRYGFTVLQEDARNTTTASEVIVSVEVTLTDPHTGSVISKATIRDGESFSSFVQESQGQSESEAFARARLFRRVAQAAVEKTLEHDW